MDSWFVWVYYACNYHLKSLNRQFFLKISHNQVKYGNSSVEFHLLVTPLVSNTAKKVVKLLTSNSNSSLDKMNPKIQKHTMQSIQEHKESQVEHRYQDLKLQINMNCTI